MSLPIDGGSARPDPIPLRGFSDIRIAAQVRPAPTTVRQDAGDWGRAAALSLVAPVKGEPRPAATFAPKDRRGRASTSAPRPGWTWIDKGNGDPTKEAY
jgi:DNA-binding LacI/PurR family transcriptional regulator